ncbi:MAG TPA: DUF3891 family protein [Solirubrobacteraceae bacterium]|nr:DUF3891 family protein [Solirubrobacteraceae bacterium]
MLLRRSGEDALIIGQASHAWLSGQLARAWGNDRFPAPDPREEVCLAACQHDVGWAEWDLQPALNPADGWPHSFMDMPDLAAHIELWSTAPDRLLSQSVYAALLVSMHGTALYARRDLGQLAEGDADLIRRYLEAERGRQAQLAARLGADRAQLARNQRLIWTWDSMSLAICLPWDPHTATRVPAGEEEVDLEMRGTAPDRFEVRPWPFSTPEIRVHCEARRLTERYDGERELRAALAGAPLERLAFTLSQ